MPLYPPIDCWECGTEFVPLAPNARYCCFNCSIRAQRHARKNRGRMYDHRPKVTPTNKPPSEFDIKLQRAQDEAIAKLRAEGKHEEANQMEAIVLADRRLAGLEPSLPKGAPEREILNAIMDPDIEKTKQVEREELGDTSINPFDHLKKE